MTTVAFMLTARGNNREDAESKMRDLCQRLDALCKDNQLELQDRYFIDSGCIIEWAKNDWQARYNLEIFKRHDITYNQIYALVNSIQPVHFTIVRPH